MMIRKTQIDTTSISNRRKRGFSLLELTVAMAMFLIVGAAAVSLIRRHQPLFGAQQGQVQLNLGLRNAVAQIQNDVENAGTGFFQGVDLPSFPIGIVITNNSAGTTSCYDPATHTYGPTCFDSFKLITIDQSTPPAHPLNNPASSCQSETSSILPIVAADGTSNSTLAGDFNAGDTVLIISSDGSTMVDTGITKSGVNGGSGGWVDLQHNPTGASLTDPLGINADLGSSTNNKLLHKFCNDAWVLRVATTSYSVDASDPTNPKLIRSTPGRADVVAEQIIGFKVGAYNDLTGSYSYVSSNQATDTPPGYNNDWTQIRSVRISVIGRSNPVGDPTFQNKFDQGNYYVESAAVVINPRNLSMNH
jgi:prepilin-type N-terminal cleavage/methylation domain-containing protein